MCFLASEHLTARQNDLKYHDDFQNLWESVAVWNTGFLTVIDVGNLAWETPIIGNIHLKDSMKYRGGFLWKVSADNQ